MYQMRGKPVKYCMLANFTFYFSSAEFFSKLTFSIFFRNTTRMSNSLDPNQARHFVGPDLGPKGLQRLSADDKSYRWRDKS